MEEKLDLLCPYDKSKILFDEKGLYYCPKCDLKQISVDFKGLEEDMKFRQSPMYFKAFKEFREKADR